MAWIESHQELRNHPKVSRLSRILSIPKVQAIGHLHALWWWAMDYSPDGLTSDWTPEDIADGAMWDGDAERFHEALISSRWIDADGMLHDWGDYAGKILDKRATDRERKRLSRGRPPDVRVTAQVPNLTIPKQQNLTEQTPVAHSRFICPSFEDVRTYFLEQHSSHREAEKFENYYASNGWMVGKNKMKDWHRAANGWILRSNEQAHTNGHAVQEPVEMEPLDSRTQQEKDQDEKDHAELMDIIPPRRRVNEYEGYTRYSQVPKPA